MTTSAKDTLAKRSRNPLSSLWFWVVLAFVILITAWSTLITVAVKNGPELIDLDQVEVETETAHE